MNKLVFLLLLLVGHVTSLSAQTLAEKKVESTLDSVKVFLEGAQMNRSTQVSLTAGKSVIVLQGLSPFIHPQSIQVKSKSNLMVLSVNHRLDYLGAKEKNELQTRMEAIEDSIAIERAMQEVLDEELIFLKENNEIAGTENGLSLANLKEISTYYQDRMKAIRLEAPFR